MKLIHKYFPELLPKQSLQLSELTDLYQEWNKKINVVSRTDLQNLEERHILHSLAICKLVSFRADAKILDLGTGGGFPGIPLAIYYPNSNFHLIDGIKKKITVVEAVSKKLELTNVVAEQLRAEDLNEEYDYIVIRAVADIKLLWKYCKNLLKPEGLLVCLKGGNVQEELSALPTSLVTSIKPISEFFSEDFFIDKFIVTVRNS